MKSWLKCQLELVIAGNDWLETWGKMRSGADGVAQMLESDVGSARLEQLLKASKRLDAAVSAALSMNASLQPEQLETHASLLYFDCRVNFEKFLQHEGVVDMLANKVTTITRTMDELALKLMDATKEFGTTTESSWKYTITADTPLKNILEQAARTIDTIDGEMVTSLTDQLFQEPGDEQD